MSSRHSSAPGIMTNTSVKIFQNDQDQQFRLGRRYQIIHQEQWPLFLNKYRRKM